MLVKAPHRSDHDAGGQAADLELVARLQVADQAVVLSDDLGKTLGRIIEGGEAVAPGGEEAAGFGHGV